MSSLRTSLCVMLAMGTCGSVFVGAATIVSDQFVYPAGPISGQNGGHGWGSAYTGNGQINAGSLPYLDPVGELYSTAGNRVSTITDGNGMFRIIALANQPPNLLDPTGRLGADGTRVYIGFLVRLDSGIVTAFGDYGGISLFDATSEQLFFGVLGFQGTHIFWGVDPQEGSAAVRDSSTQVSAVIRLLVGRIDFNLGSETVRFYVDPPLHEEPATPTVGPFTMHDFRFTRIRIQSGGNGRYSFDELKVATTYSEAVPEPCTATLVSGAFLLLSLKRASRSRRHAAGNRRVEALKR